MSIIVPRPVVLLFQLLGANMNSTADQSFVKLFDFTNWTSIQIRALNASISLTTAAGGIYSAASKGGFTFVAASQAYSGLASSALGIALGTTANAIGLNSVTPILSLTTPQGAAATCDLYVFGTPLP